MNRKAIAPPTKKVVPTNPLSVVKWGVSLLATNPYNRLLLALIVFIVTHPMTSDSTSLLFFNAITILIVALSINSGRLKRRGAVFYALLAIGAFIGQIMLGDPTTPDIDGGTVALTVGLLVNATFLAVSVISFTRYIFTETRVSADTIKGGLCGYILLGLTWALIYQTFALWNPDAFLMSCTDCKLNVMYFSFTTLTTLGYGDISPVDPTVQVLASLQAIVGIMYPSIFISRLVGLYSKSDA
ncbi:Ion channel [Rubidibacter lacunae KORDI 51-2]|uniref:Ion channel n=1 Tax=Rubidibacter lacunae KORDI 51-2 TaxID=582515 RepID=U5DKD2_9CHRO|nr:potassium channel family protein [Rubidibacter lacunae]ERN41377.1 Ion channel [Rubidibacter lacunae KORDI 51-2]